MERLQNIPIRYVKGIGPKRAEIFNKIGIHTLEDLLYYFPRRYEDRTKFTAISKLEAGLTQTIKARVLAKGERSSFRGRRFSILELAVEDESGKIFCVWFNQPYLKQYLTAGQELILYGRVELRGKRLQMVSPEFEVVTEDSGELLNIARIVPVYSLPEGLGQRVFRRLIKSALDGYLSKVNDFLPFDVRSRNNLLNLAKSLINIHFPESPELQSQAYERLAFEEFFLFQIPLVLRKLQRKEKMGLAHVTEGKLAKDFIAGLPFQLTGSQEKVIQEIKQDMARPQAMQRLLQGDVGSGKTVVATAASLIAIQGRYQAAFMVPTEILAKQHYEKITSQLQTPNSKLKEIKIGLLTSSVNKKEKEKIYREIKDGKVDLVIGTHALLEGGAEFKSLGLVIIDEQHKFGVGQRALLPGKGSNPDILIMTATPIPRTLAITLYGDLDISIIKELPPGRVPVKTFLFSKEQQAKAYAMAKSELKKGRQAYIIYPVIEESFALDISGAKKMYEELKKGAFKEFRLGLIHGRLKQNEQDSVMRKFKNGELDALVSTTVLEVGIDMPNATCMIIEHAERFGLSQLHQLRGRIGRGTEESICLLISGSQTPDSSARLAAMAQYNDGFRIAEEDLKIRGPGEFFGARQHGLTELRIGNPLTQMQLLKRAREEAIKLTAIDRHFELRQNLLLKQKLVQRFPEYEKLMLVG